MKIHINTFYSPYVMSIGASGIQVHNQRHLDTSISWTHRAVKCSFRSVIASSTLKYIICYSTANTIR